MITIQTNPSNPKFIFLQCDNPAEIHKLESHLNLIPQYMLLPTYKGIPKPEVFLDWFRSKKFENKKIYYCLSGLWKEVLDFCKSNGIDIDNKLDDKSFKYNRDFNLNKEEFRELIKSWNLNIAPHDYQIDAAWLILKYRFSLSELATRSGKTLIMYLVIRAAMETCGIHKTLVIVPSIQLVKQGASDLQEYGEFFTSEQIWAKGEQIVGSNLTIGTFQSLVKRSDKESDKYDPNFFKEYDMVIVDEAHKLPCKSIRQILDCFESNLKLKFGFTGTLPKPNTIEWYACQAMMGPKIQTIRAIDLIDNGYLAEPHIKQIRLIYDDSDEKLLDTKIECGEYLCSYFKLDPKSRNKIPLSRKDFTIQYEKVLPTVLILAKRLYYDKGDKEKYWSVILNLLKESTKVLDLEQMLVHRSKGRLDVIGRIIQSENGNGIIFAHHTEYINYLVKFLKESFSDKAVHKITGGTNLKKRQETLDKMLESDNNILVGSYGCVSTGLTFKSVSYGILTQSFKSDIINKQSLGRLMLRNENKTTFNVYDLVDIFPETKRIYRHGLERIRTYDSEGFRSEVVNKDVKYSHLINS